MSRTFRYSLNLFRAICPFVFGMCALPERTDNPLALAVCTVCVCLPQHLKRKLKSIDILFWFYAIWLAQAKIAHTTRHYQMRTVANEYQTTK